MHLIIASASLGTLILGFIVGYFGFKIRTRWCPIHGSKLRCPDCAALVAAGLSPAGRL